MKKAFVTLIALLMFAGSVYALNPPTNFTMTNPSATYSPVTTMKVVFTMPANATVWDSILVVQASDSSVTVAAIDTTGIDWDEDAVNTVYVTALTPATSYKWQIRVVDVDTMETSNEDTLSTKQIQVGQWETDAVLSLDTGRPMRRWDSWKNFAAPIDTTKFRLVDATDTDSTVVYNAWDFNNAMIRAYGDSVHVTALVYAGICSADTFLVTYEDSLLMTTKGTYRFTNDIIMSMAEHFYIKLRSNTPNGKVGHPTTMYLWLNRSRFQGVR